MPDDNVGEHGWIKVFRAVKDVGGAILVVGAIAAGVTTFLSKRVTDIVERNIVGAIAEERVARTAADTLIIRRLELLDSRVVSLGEALKHPLYSDARQDALEKTTAPPPRPKRRR